MLTYAKFIIVKNLRKLNFNFVDATFSLTLTMFLVLGGFLLKKINIKLIIAVKLWEKYFNSFYNSLLYVLEETKSNSVQIRLILYCFITQIPQKELHFINK